LHNPIAHELAELLSENFLRDAGHNLPQSRKVFRRFHQPVHNDQLPFTADRCQRSRQWAPNYWIGTSRVIMAFYEGELWKNELEAIAMPMLESYGVILCGTSPGYVFDEFPNGL